MKVATNLQQQQFRQQKKEKEPREDKSDLIIKRIEALKKEETKGVGMPTRPKIDRITNNPTMGKNKYKV